MNNIFFAGLGLIGGSIAKTLRARHPSCRIGAYDVDPHTLEMAAEQKIIDYAAVSADRFDDDCECLFLCAPVADNTLLLGSLNDRIPRNCLITDIGSVKSPIHREASLTGKARQFIGGHPMAGSERTGFAGSKASLLENAYYILTPAAESEAVFLERYRELVLDMGAIPLVMSCEEHDYITAAVSHLPHIIAASLVRLVRDQDSAEGVMKMIAAGGFKDITRIASSSPVMWQQICLSNQQNISLLLEEYINALTSVNQEIKAMEAGKLFGFFEEARTYRESFVDTSGGPIKKSYSVYVDIPDKTGALAAIVSLLAGHGISIKNIGITHNREQEEGVLLVEFYDEKAVREACRFLDGAGYIFRLKS